MAKLTGALKITGKLKSADMTFVDGRNGIHVRSLPKVKTRKTEQFQQHADNAGDVSRLAGQLTRLFKEYARENTGIRMYTKLLSRMRKMRTGNRLIILHELIGVNANSLKSMLSLGMQPVVKGNIEGHRLRASIDYANHPPLVNGNNFYRLELILVQWNNGTDEPASEEQHTKWITPADVIKGYDMLFDLSEHCMDWIVLMRCRLAEEKGTKRIPPTDIVQIINAGSYDAASVAQLREYPASKKAARAKERGDRSEEDDGLEGRERNGL